MSAPLGEGWAGRPWRRFACAALLLLLAACAHPNAGPPAETELATANPFNVDLSARGKPGPKFDTPKIESELAPDDGDDDTPDVIASAEQIAAAMPELRGLTYQAGLASWYGGRHHGTRTADGGRFDKRQMTAAHPTLPLGLEVKVMRLSTGKTVTVTINDRHPFLGKRIIDLSEAAARALGFRGQGLTKVVVIVPEDRGDLADLLTRQSMNETRWMLREARPLKKRSSGDKARSSKSDKSEKSAAGDKAKSSGDGAKKRKVGSKR